MKGSIEERRVELGRLYPRWEKKTIWGYFTVTAERFPEHDFVVTECGERYSYRQAKEKIIHIARALVSIGVSPGTRVAIQLENCCEYVFLGLALSAIRAIHVRVNPREGQKELGRIIDRSGCRYLVTGCTIHLSGAQTELTTVIAFASASCDVDVPVLKWSDLLAIDEGEPLPSYDVKEYADEISDIVYTSGSTDAPKGVPLTHDMLMRSVFANALHRGTEIGRRIFVPVPLCHNYGSVKGVLTAILVGGTVLLTQGKFNAERALDFLQASRANDLLSVPTQIIDMIACLRKAPRNLPDLHAVFCTASVCPPWVWGEIRALFHVSDVVTSYGMSEVSGSTTLTLPTDSDEILKTRVGKVLYGGCAGLPEYDGAQIQYKVIDRETGSQALPGETGELYCRGAVVISNYYNDPALDKKSFTADGWFKTGDCGYFDDEGYLVYTGRVDDMYKINGENVFPKFVEDIISDCELVSIVAVVGIPDEKHGHVGAAFIQLHTDSREDRLDVERYCRDHLASYQLPRYFIYMTEEKWPRTATGKIQKFRLRSLLRDHSL